MTSYKELSVKYINGLFWIITDDGEIIKEVGGFIDPLTPEIIIKEIEN